MDLLTLLKTESRARERKNKNRAIGNILIEKHFQSIGTEMLHPRMNKELMQEIVGEILTLDRQWRKILEENPDLRGSDYGDKAELEVVKQRELGYNVK